jgi:hypothetical protein
MPLHGRYVAQPAETDENGVRSVPPAAPDLLPKQALLYGAAATLSIVSAVLFARRQRRANPRATTDSGSHDRVIQGYKTFKFPVTGPGPSRPGWRKGGVGS